MSVCSIKQKKWKRLVLNGQWEWKGHQWNEKAKDNQSQKDSTEPGWWTNLAGGGEQRASLSYWLSVPGQGAWPRASCLCLMATSWCRNIVACSFPDEEGGREGCTELTLTQLGGCIAEVRVYSCTSLKPVLSLSYVPAEGQAGPLCA